MPVWIIGSEYRPSKLVKVDMMINGEPVDALSFISHVSKAPLTARKMAEKLKEFMQNPATLEKAAAAAKTCGQPQAAGNLADVVEKRAKGPKP